MGPVILIVDDDPATLAGLVSLVEGAGYSGLGASDYVDGRRLLAQLPVDLVVVDVRLGAYNGLQLIVFARSLPSPPAAIVTSGFDDRVLEDEAQHLGAPFLLKPIDPGKLLSQIEVLLSQRQS
jgi:two-component system phosphoglycerate transport system response regulator PgtA